MTLKEFEEHLKEWSLELKEGAIKLLESSDSVTNVITGTNARRSPYFNLIELDKSGEVHLSGERKKWKEMKKAITWT